MSIILREINRDNWKECIKLKPDETQVNFVASNVYSLLESKFEPSFFPLAIYSNETMVGFVMYGLDDDDGSWWVIRLMVDQNHQKNGYGKAAMLEAIEILRNKPGCARVFTSYVPENLVAEKLYLSLGFEKTGKIEDGEIVVCLPLDTKIER
ncbi:GNAT family N-acetyltransferase [Mastigocoleus testarum]|uniref:Spermidine acetyltransferase n=1 Tax=Mastigocoleus testarum BC008 TaxID=371196 RepID=A0A0V7ZUT7_9CYAN|nr:GNAT family N-acetyltransferase [Mastigocoleus testarum]KST68250.1 spermidine acetyltransferase [Mastigocoleus testarum BC008]KST68260.1 spermidine acetyltransferase [Mastigocoleus testarum BC008]